MPFHVEKWFWISHAFFCVGMQVLKLFPTEHEEEDGEVDADEWDAKKGAANFFYKKNRHLRGNASGKVSAFTISRMPWAFPVWRRRPPALPARALNSGRRRGQTTIREIIFFWEKDCRVQKNSYQRERAECDHHLKQTNINTEIFSVLAFFLSTLLFW